MDTTQKNREQTRAGKPVRQSRPARQDASLPPSAQQRNGAARTAEEQRSAASRPRPKAEPERQKQAVPKQRQAAPEGKKAPAENRKKPAAPPAGQRKPPAAQEKAASQRKSPAGQGKAAAPQRKAAPARTKEAAPQPRQKELPDSVSTKKRAYGNSKPKKKSTLTLVNEKLKQTAQRNSEKAKQARKTPKKNRPQQPSPAVIYTQPQAFNRSRLFVQLLTVLAVVAALVLGLSVFFKVETITVSGEDVYSKWAVREASGIAEGDNLLTFSHARAAARIKAELPYVNSVRFGIKLPDTVNIIIEEEDVVYAIKNKEGTWWLMNSTGRLIEQSNSSVAAGCTQIVGVTVDNPVSGERAVATESAALMETDESGATVPVPVTVTGAQRLSTALKILQALEDNDIVGDAASVDVTRLEEIILWYGTRYQVNLGDSGNIDHKINCMNDVILQMSEYQSGILDISFTIWPDQVVYTPFG